MLANFQKRAVTSEEKRIFSEQGVVCLRGIIDRSFVAPLRSATEQRITKLKPIEHRSEGVNGGYYLESMLWRHSEIFKRAAIEGPLAAISADILDSNRINLYEDTLFARAPNTSADTPWHQDQAYYWADGTQVATLWLPLASVSLAQGPVTYIKGSHRWGRWFRPVTFSKRKMEVEEFEPLEPILAELDPNDLISYATEPGDCIVHHGLTIHGAGGNNSTQWRLAMAWGFTGDDVRYATRQFKSSDHEDAGLNPGDRLDSNAFPVIWPRTNPCV